MTKLPITVPNFAEIKATAEALNLKLNDQELEMYGAFIEPIIADYQAIEAMDAPRLPVKYPRENAYRPGDVENTHNAWYYKALIEGAPAGKLNGKRIVIKDNISVAGVPMMNGSKVWEGFTPEEDATVVTRVLDAGGTIVGKAVCENLCFSGGSHTSATGPVRNPHNPDFMAGGSSSGCAALLVAGECDLAIGSDQGGSVRMPASFSGVYGIKPTFGLVPYTGAFPIEQSVDHLGPMAMSTEDCALLLEVIAGYDDGLDPRQDSSQQSKAYRDALTGDVKGLRVAIVKEGFARPESEADVDAMVKAAASRFVDAGAEVNEISLPAHASATSIMFVSMLEGTLSTINEMSGAGSIVNGHFQLDAMAFFEKVRKERANELPVTVKTVLLASLAMRNRYGVYYSAKANNLVRTLRAKYNQALQDHDILVMPTTAMKALRIPATDAPIEQVMASALPMIGNTAPFDATGHPSMSVPVGFSEGLPVGMMLTGRLNEDDVVLRAAHAFEQLG